MFTRLSLGLLVCLSATHAQPVFEAASVRPSQSEAPARLTSDPGTWSCLNCRLFDLFGHAYSVFEYQIVAPDWTKTATFDVIAKLPAGAARADFAPMMRSLLEERFQMTAHREKREVPVYRLVIARGGAKLKELSAPAPAPPPGPAVDNDGFPTVPGGNGMRLLPGRGRIQFGWQSMANVAHFIATQVDRPVIDATGLEGHYALTLSWYRDTARTAPPAVFLNGVAVATDASSGPDIFEAVQAQLGLKLQPGNAFVEHVVIDRVEKSPIEN